MKPVFGPPPGAEQLRGVLLHEVVRMWPETLHVLENHGVALHRSGSGRIGQAVDDDGQLIQALLDVTAWRSGRPTQERPSP